MEKKKIKRKIFKYRRIYWVIPCLCIALIIALLLFQAIMEKKYHCFGQNSNCSVLMNYNLLYEKSSNIEIVLSFITLLSSHILLIGEIVNTIKKSGQDNKNKKYWLIPAITLGLAALLVLIEEILMSSYPLICSANSLSKEYIPKWAPNLSVLTISIMILSIIGISSLVYIMCYSKTKSNTNEIQKIKHYSIPVTLLIMFLVYNVAIICMIMVYKKTESYNFFHELSGGLGHACDSTDQAALIIKILIGNSIGITVAIIISIIFIIYFVIPKKKKQNKKN